MLLFLPLDGRSCVQTSQMQTPSEKMSTAVVHRSPVIISAAHQSHCCHRCCAICASCPCSCDMPNLPDAVSTIVFSCTLACTAMLNATRAQLLAESVTEPSQQDFTSCSIPAGPQVLCSSMRMSMRLAIAHPGLPNRRYRAYWCC